MPPQKGTERYRLWKLHIDEAAAKRRNVPLTPSHCEKISISNTGRIKSQEECDNISNGLKNKPKSKLHRQHLSEAGMGRTPWNKGLPTPQETCDKIRKSKLGIYPSDKTRKKRSLSLMGNKNKLGYITPKETREKMRNSAHKGKDHHNWKDGITKIEKAIRRLPEYDNWRYGVFGRDNYTCRDCGQHGGDLEGHHDPKTFAQIIQENNIKTIGDALKCKELWDIENGVTLCVDCHKKRHNK